MTAPKRVFLVMGQRGEYDDYCTWPVVAFANEEEALVHAIYANDEAARLREVARASVDGCTELNRFDPTVEAYAAPCCDYSVREIGFNP